MSTLTGRTYVPKTPHKLLKNCLNHLKLFKPSKSSKVPNSGLSWIGVGPVLEIWHYDVLFLSGWPEMTIPGFGPLATSRMGSWWCHHWCDCRCGWQMSPCAPKSSQGILGQLDTRSLSQGIPDLEDLDMVPLESAYAVTVVCIIVIHFDCSAGICLFLLLMSWLRLILVLKL